MITALGVREISVNYVGELVVQSSGEVVAPGHGQASPAIGPVYSA
jgi:hypothetical protein